MVFFIVSLDMSSLLKREEREFVKLVSVEFSLVPHKILKPSLVRVDLFK